MTEDRSMQDKLETLWEIDHLILCYRTAVDNHVRIKSCGTEYDEKMCRDWLRQAIWKVINSKEEI